MQIRDIPVGDGAPLLLIAGLNVLESLDGALECADAVADIAERHGVSAVFKASYDKANRSSPASYRGPGLDEGLRILERVPHLVSHDGNRPNGCRLGDARRQPQRLTSWIVVVTQDALRALELQRQPCGSHQRARSIQPRHPGRVRYLQVAFIGTATFHCA